MTPGFLIAVPVLAVILIPLPKPARHIVAALLISSLFAIFWPSAHQTYRLEKEGYHTTGVLITKDCSREKHPRITYRFRVGDKEFESTGSPGAGNQPCKNFQSGDQVFITYLPSDPEINRPEREVDSLLFLGILFLLATYPVLVGLNAAQARFWKEKQKRRES
ncbi:MAG TPA: DUF3592 domain-containing protein [Noviherbaspirillum sp.]